MGTAQQTIVPAGTWTSDPVHSTLEFSVKHMVVATYRARMTDFQAVLRGGEDGSAALEGVGRVASVVAADENLTGHLQSPDFFDGQRHPETRFRSTEIVADGDQVVVRGELTLKGVTGPLELRGTLSGPVVAAGDIERIGLELDGAIDRTDYGVSWNAPLPAGGMVLGDTVRLHAQLELVRS